MAHKTYEIGHKRRRNWRRILVVLAALLLLAGGYYIYVQFKESTKPLIKNTAGTTRPLEIPNSKTQHFDQSSFGFDLPVDWKLIKHDTAPYNLYSYRATLTNADNRALDVYVDALPQSLAVNKAVAVRGQGSNLSHGEASENCITFTSATSSEAHTRKPLAILAKWDGVEFLCDNDNTNRNVIGTSAPGTVNKVTLTSLTTGPHSFFFVYTDDNATPDYTIFYRMLESFIVK